MQKHNVQIGTTYIAKVSGTLAKVRLTREHDRGGWYGINLATGREIRIRTAARLRSEVKPAPAISHDEALRIDGPVRVRRDPLGLDRLLHRAEGHTAQPCVCPLRDSSHMDTGRSANFTTAALESCFRNVELQP